MGRRAAKRADAVGVGVGVGVGVAVPPFLGLELLRSAVVLAQAAQEQELLLVGAAVDGDAHTRHPRAQAMGVRGARSTPARVAAACGMRRASVARRMV
jgi:hypothetical protein